MSDERLCIFGEVLFDHFPDGKRVLGGAPFNVAWHLQAFGRAPLFVSRVGGDPDGEAVRAAMRGWGMDEAALEQDPALPTGRVAVRFQGGEPRYDIRHPAAFDAIAARSLAGEPRLLYHGSLAVREAASRAALEHLRAQRPERVFVDVNLRAPWWEREDLTALLAGADWVKLNGEELALLAGDGAADPRAFLQRHGLQGLVLTRGGEGAELIEAAGHRHRVAPRAAGPVVDAVGAGDAFAAVVLLGLDLGWPVPALLDRAQEFASAICGQRGATVADPAFYRPFVRAWGLEEASTDV